MPFRNTLMAMGALCLIGATTMQAADDAKAVESRILELLMAEEFKQDAQTIVDYGPKALPVLEKVLADPKKHGGIRATRALIILRRIVVDKKKIMPLVQVQLASADASVRYQAVMTAGQLGNEKCVPPLVALLWDETSGMRYQAIKSIGQVGGASAITALKIWAAQAEAKDKMAKKGEPKILDPDIRKLFKDAIKLIQDRL